MRIREAEGKDTDALVFLEQTCFADAFSRDTILEMLGQRDYVLLTVCEDTGRDGRVIPVGYAGYRKALDEGDVMHVCVLPEYRRQGLALRLMEALILRAVEEGTARIFLEVRASNTAAIGLYKKIGFRETGIRKDYYRHPREDALIMELNTAAAAAAEVTEQEKEERDA